MWNKVSVWTSPYSIYCLASATDGITFIIICAIFQRGLTMSLGNILISTIFCHQLMKDVMRWENARGERHWWNYFLLFCLWTFLSTAFLLQILLVPQKLRRPNLCDMKYLNMHWKANGTHCSMFIWSLMCEEWCGRCSDWKYAPVYVFRSSFLSVSFAYIFPSGVDRVKCVKVKGVFISARGVRAHLQHSDSPSP